MNAHAASADARSAQGPGRVLGVAFTLALLLGALAWIGKGLFVATVDGAEKQRQYFGEQPPPFGLALDSAVRLPGGDALVRFARTGDDGERNRPLDVVFLELRSRSAAEAMLRPSPEDFPGAAGMRLKEWEKAKAFAWHMTRKRGDVAWGTWSTKLLIERSYEKGGSWREEARVDLSTPERPLVLLAHWPAEVAVDEKVMRELLGTVVMAPPAGG